MAKLLSRRDEALALRLAAGRPGTTGEFNDFLDRVRAEVVEAAPAAEPVRRRLHGHPCGLAGQLVDSDRLRRRPGHFQGVVPQRHGPL